MARYVTPSVLDLAPVTSGSSTADALRHTLDLARHADGLGFLRYWVAEHHNMPGIASSSPAVLIGHIADVTEHLRVGSGGVMLPNHAPLVVAEQFGMLEALHPGRIDLGIGRAPGTDPLTAAALRRSADALGADDFPEQLMDLIGFFTGRFPDDHPYARITAVPALGNMPALWILGSSGYGAQVAGVLGLPFAFAHHFSADFTMPALDLYRRSFRASDVLAEPYAMIGVGVVCADDEERAQWLAAPGALSYLRLRTGRPGPFPTPAEAAAYPYSEAERAAVEGRLRNTVVGPPETVRRRLEALADETGVDELMVTTVVHDHGDRVRSYELLAQEWAARRSTTKTSVSLGPTGPLPDAP